MRPHRRLGLIACAAVLALAACGGGGGGEGSAGAGGGAANEASSPVEGSSDALRSFRAPAIGGGEVDAATFRGRPMLLWFWAPW